MRRLLSLALLVAIIGCDVQMKAPTRVVAFTATWCVVCQHDKPALREIESAGIRVDEIDWDASPELVKQYSVSSVPEYFVIKDEQTIARTHNLSTVQSVLKGF